MKHKITTALDYVHIPTKLTLGIFLPIESYRGAIPTMKDQVALAQRAEAYGFKALWFRDVPLHVPSFGDAGQVYDPWVYMSYLAAHTKTICLATGSIILPLRHPIHTAKSASSLDHLSNGRLIMGIASGDRPIEYPAFGKDLEQRATLFQENVTYLKTLWKSFPNHASPLGAMTGEADLIPKPIYGSIPLLATGRSGQSLTWIAQNTDGWVYYPRDLSTVQQLIGEWHRTLEQENQPTKPFLQSLYIDLLADANAPAHPIHLGFQSGRNYLLEFLGRLEIQGVSHVIINLKYGTRPADEVLEELGTEIVPHFNEKTDDTRAAKAEANGY